MGIKQQGYVFHSWVVGRNFHQIKFDLNSEWLEGDRHVKIWGSNNGVEEDQGQRLEDIGELISLFKNDRYPEPMSI